MNKKEQVLELLNLKGRTTSINWLSDQIDAIYNEPNEFEFGEMVKYKNTHHSEYNKEVDLYFLCKTPNGKNILTSKDPTFSIRGQSFDLYLYDQIIKLPLIEVTQAELIAEYKKSKNIEGDIKII